MSTLPGFSNKITYGTKPTDEPLLNYYQLSIPMEDWNKLTPEQQIAKFYSEGTKVFRNGSTLAPGQITPTPANTVMTAYNRDQFTTPAPSATATNPQLPAAIQQPQVTLPDIFSQNASNATPTSNPLSIPNSITMPTQMNRASTFGNNWSDFLTVAHNRQMR